jgi:hypothetical protein
MYFEHNPLESPTKQIRLIKLLPRHYDGKDSLKGAEAPQFAHVLTFSQRARGIDAYSMHHKPRFSR